MRQSAARGGVEAERLKKTETTTRELTKAEVTGYFPLRVNFASPYGLDADAVTQLYIDDFPTSPPLAPQLGDFLWQWAHVGQWEMRACGSSLCEPVHLCHLLPPLTQAMHHLQRTVGLLSACWSPRAPAGQGQADELPLCCSKSYSFMLQVQNR